MAKHGKYHEYTEREITEAEKKFKERGGLVQKLPEELTSRVINVLPRGYIPCETDEIAWLGR